MGIVRKQREMKVSEKTNLIRKEISPYISKYGVITRDINHEDGNDGPHKTGLYYGALGILKDIQQSDIDNMVKLFENIVDRSGNLLRYPTTRFGKDRYFWQESSRDQYIAIFGGLAFMRGKDSRLDAWASRLWEVLKHKNMAGDGFIMPNHFNFFSRCMGEVDTVPKVKYWLGEVSILVGFFLECFNQIISYVPLINKAFPKRGPGRSINSTRILFIYRLRVSMELEPSWFGRLTWKLMQLVFNPWYEFESYFLFSWDGTTSVPIHLAWKPILKP